MGSSTIRLLPTVNLEYDRGMRTSASVIVKGIYPKTAAFIRFACSHATKYKSLMVKFVESGIISLPASNTIMPTNDHRGLLTC